MSLHGVALALLVVPAVAAAGLALGEIRLAGARLGVGGVLFAGLATGQLGFAVLKSLLNKGLIKEVRAKRDDTVWRHDGNRGRMTLVATNAAFAALGIEEALAEGETDGAPEDSRDASEKAVSPKSRKAKSHASRTAAPRSRDGSKQAQLIAMLRRAKGATVDEIAEALSWQRHTVRGAIAGALKKKLGLEVASEKDPKRGRIYLIAWGTRDHLELLFGSNVTIAAERRNFNFRYKSPAHWVEVFRTYYGPVLKAFAALDGETRIALERDLSALIDEFNIATDGTMVVPSAYLEVVATRH